MMLMLVALAINYSLVMIVAPQYAIYGPQTYCSAQSLNPDEQPQCEAGSPLIKPCYNLSKDPGATAVCTPSVVSTFLNRITVNFPFFGVICFWAQFAFLGIYLIFVITALFRTPKLDEQQLDEDAEEAEEEGLLASAGRRFGATWEDITGRSRGGASNGYGAAGANTGEED
jgi:LMBR1 domain-containing protein 1